MMPAHDSPARMGTLPLGSCPGSLRALMGPDDTVKIGPNNYITVCYDCELEVAVDVLLTTMAGVMTPLPRVAIHPEPYNA